MPTPMLAARPSGTAVPLELRFVKSEDALVSAARNSIAAGARRIRIEPPEAAMAFISALAPDADSGLQFPSGTGAEQAQPPLSTATAPEADLVVIAASDPARIDAALMSCLDLKTGLVLALLTEHHWARSPLVMTQVAHTGSHLCVG